MAARPVYFENAVGRIWEEPLNYLRLDYYAAPREEVAFRALLMHALQALVRRGWGKILIDQRKMAPYSDAERAWMMDEWLPRAIREGGYRYGAVVLAENPFARVSMTRLALASRELGNTYKTFDTENDAVDWLTQAVVVR